MVECIVVGCPDVSELESAWVLRRGDTAIVKCNFTGETYFLTCVGTRWKGELSRCSIGELVSSYRMKGLDIPAYSG